MSVYKNENGTLKPIASNNKIVDQPLEGLVTKEEFDAGMKNKLDVITDTGRPVKATVIFSFDQAAIDARVTVLEEYGYRGVFSDSGSVSNELMRELADRGHDYSIYGGTGTRPGLDASVDDWYDYISGSVAGLASVGLRYPTLYSCPGHSASLNMIEACEKLGFKYVRCASISDNTTTMNHNWIFPRNNTFNPFQIAICPIGINKGWDTVKATLDEAIENNYIVMLFAHKPDYDSYTEEYFRQVVEYVHTKVSEGVLDCLTPREYYDRYRHENDFKQMTIDVKGMPTIQQGKGLLINNGELITNNQRITGRYNVLDYGLIGDGSTDNTDALRAMLDAVPTGAAIYFPIGTYSISEAIVIPKPLFFIGDTIISQGITISSSLISYVGDDTNISMFSAPANSYMKVGFKGLAFEGNSFSIDKNSDAFVELPYPYFKEATTLENVSCLTFGENQKDGSAYISDCAFRGFSGHAILTDQHKIIKNCTFQNCNVAAKVVFDSMVQSCWFKSCGVAIELVKDDTHLNGSANISDCWADALSRHFVTSTNTNTVIQLSVNNVWVDMVDRAAFYFTGNLEDAHIQGTFGRIGMTYAGLDDGDRTTAIAPYSDFLCANNIRNSVFDITEGAKTVINGNNANAECVSKYLFATQTYGMSDLLVILPKVNADKIFDMVNDVAYRAKSICKDGDVEFHSGYIFINGTTTINRSPIGYTSHKPPRAGVFAVDSTNGDIYRSTGNTEQDWELANISLNKLKDLASASSDFADFQTRIANM